MPSSPEFRKRCRKIRLSEILSHPHSKEQRCSHCHIYSPGEIRILLYGIQKCTKQQITPRIYRCVIVKRSIYHRRQQISYSIFFYGSKQKHIKCQPEIRSVQPVRLIKILLDMIVPVNGTLDHLRKPAQEQHNLPRILLRLVLFTIYVNNI